MWYIYSIFIKQCIPGVNIFRKTRNYSVPEKMRLKKFQNFSEVLKKFYLILFTFFGKSNFQFEFVCLEKNCSKIIKTFPKNPLNSKNYSVTNVTAFCEIFTPAANTKVQNSHHHNEKWSIIFYRHLTLSVLDPSCALTVGESGMHGTNF